MLAAVILSGGASQRMGSPKALLPYRGKTFLEHLLEVSTHPKITERRVVLGPDAETIRADVPLPDSEIVVNAEWEKGQLSSIHAAIRSLPGSDEVDGMILFLIDHPAISSTLVDKLIARFYDTTPRPRIVLPKFKDRRGHPVIFSSQTFLSLLDAPLETGARAVVLQNVDHLAAIETDEEGCVLNVNDAASLERLKEL
ncbi:MAG TPA: nucleotidyltransferase family protein [Candidatus Acidoferrum sp.]|jgi:molybdenum cofactor cytidylyltransferase